MLKWKRSAATLITTMLCISNPASARFLSNDPVTAQEHLKQGNIQGMNRYAYVNNNPYKYTDPDGRVLLPVGTQKQTARINQMLTKIEGSSPVLKARITGLRKSKYVHIIEQVEAGKKVGNMSMGNTKNEKNDIGTGSITALELDKPFTVIDGPSGSYGEFTSSPEAVLVHELAGHASQVDQGKIDDNRGETGLRNSEAYGIDTGNIYREANGEELRKK